MLKKLQNNIEFFHKNGYVIIEDIYTPEECDLIINSAHDILGQSNKDLTPLMNIHKGSNGGSKFYGKKRVDRVYREFL